MNTKDPNYEGHERAYQNGLENSRVVNDCMAQQDLSRLSVLVDYVMFTDDAYWEGRIRGLLERKEELDRP